MSLPPRVSLVTLGVRDLAASTAFYERLGWRRSGVSNEEVSFFHTGGAALALYPSAALAADARSAVAADGPVRVALAANVPERADVDAALAAAAHAGARVTKGAEDAPWGGRSGYFLDPDGHLWEVAWNPHFPLEPDGRVRLPD